MAHQWLTGWWNQGASGNRRQRQRIEGYFDCSWMSVWGDQKARISSISPTGCYIDSRFTVPPPGLPGVGTPVAHGRGKAAASGRAWKRRAIRRVSLRL